MADFFISDTHFGHSSVIEYCSRPFADVQQMDEYLCDAWNSTVTSRDRVFVLGDFSFHRGPETGKILDKLRGQKFLIKGNHDYSKTISKLSQFNRISTYEDTIFTLESGERISVVMSHFPFLSWNKMSRGSYHFHGHCHGNLRLPEGLKHARIFDVGIDNLANVFGTYAPVQLEKLVEHLRDKVPTSVDQHTLERRTT